MLSELLKADDSRRFKKARLVVGVGGHKCGTTWLYRYLCAHSQFTSGPLKEMHHFDCEFLPQLCGRFEGRFLEQFCSAPVFRHDLFLRLSLAHGSLSYTDYFRIIHDGSRAMGEVTPAYSMLDAPAFERMAASHPNPRFVFLMRNPVDRAWSSIRFAASKTGRGVGDEARDMLDGGPGHVLRADYARTLRELRRAVDAQNLLVMFFEDLFSEVSVRRLCAFLGLDYEEAPVRKRVNAAPKARLDDGLRVLLANRHKRIYREIIAEFGDAVPRRWLKDAEFIDDAHHAYAQDYAAGVADLPSRRVPQGLEPFAFGEDNPWAQLAVAASLRAKGDYDGAVRACRMAARGAGGSGTARLADLGGAERFSRELSGVLAQAVAAGGRA